MIGQFLVNFVGSMLLNKVLSLVNVKFLPLAADVRRGWITKRDEDTRRFTYAIKWKELPGYIEHQYGRLFEHINIVCSLLDIYRSYSISI